MQHDPKNEQNDRSPGSQPTDRLSRQGRSLVILALGIFSVSLIFPLLASAFPAGFFPPWFGFLDVIFAIVLMLIMIVINTATGNKIEHRAIHASYRIHRGLTSLLLVLLVIFFVAGDRIQWNVLLPGLAWRMWVLVYVLPAALTVWDRHKSASEHTMPGSRSEGE